MSISSFGINRDKEPRRLKFGDWLCRPLYARLWWSAVPIYWVAMAVSSRVEFLSAFFNSALAGFANILFFPPLVALILSYGFLKAWFARAEYDPSSDQDEHADEYFTQRKRYGPSGMLREFDPLDPASGSDWIGSPLNPSHPFYVIRHRHSS